jgi:hypothetical protein
MVIIAIILFNAFQAGWKLSVPWSYMSSTTRNQFSLPEQCFSWSAGPQCPSAGRDLGTDAGCGLLTRGYWAGPAIRNESQWGTLGLKAHCNIECYMAVLLYQLFQLE